MQRRKEKTAGCKPAPLWLGSAALQRNTRESRNLSKISEMERTVPSAPNL